MKTVNSTKAPSLRYDLILISVLLAVSVILSAAFLLLRKEGNTVVVQLDGNTVAEYSLSVNARYELNGGTNILVIEDGRAYLSDANCPDKLCVHQGKISRTGEVITCLPNKLTVTVFGAEESGEAYLSYANCPDHTCLNTGRISFVGESIICLPNRLAITVVGDGQGVDLVS